MQIIVIDFNHLLQIFIDNVYVKACFIVILGIKLLNDHIFK